MRKFSKNCQLTSYAIIFGQRNLSFIYSNAISKDHVLFKKTHSSIESGIIVVKKHVVWNFVEEYVKLKWEKER